MYEKHYVLQYRQYPHGGKWITLNVPFKTFEEAEARRQKMPAPGTYRVAESYVVTSIRYKPVQR